MKKMKMIVAAILSVGMIATSLVGCGSSSSTTSTGGATEALDISVTGGSEDSMSLNTATASGLNGLSACRHAYEGLYKLDKNGEVVLGQAKDVTVSDDKLTWTFTLRDDITWSDGEKVKASDFTYGFDYLVECADDYSSLLSDVAESYEAPDDTTVVINLKNPCGYLPSILAFPSTYPVRQDIAEKYGESYATDADKSVYNGPFKVTSWTHESDVVMERRDDYYDADQISVEKLTWILTKDESTALAQFKSGDIIYSDMCPDEEAASMEGNGLVYTAGNNNYCALFNMGPKGNDVLKDVKVREALSLAIDRQRIMDIRNLNDEMGFTLSCSGYVNADGTDFTEYADPWFDVDDYEGNCEKAKELLKEAGYENGKDFPALRYIVNNDSRKEVAESIINDWKEVLGIDTITVEKVENFFASRTEGEFDIAYYGWFMDYKDLSNMMGTMASMKDNNAFYDSAEYDAEYTAAISTGDQAEQWEHYKNCEAILAKDVPVAVILHTMNKYLFDSTNYDGLVYSCGNFVFTYITKK